MNEKKLIREVTQKEIIDRLEEKGILRKAAQAMSAAYLLCQIGDRLFFAVQDMFESNHLLHYELKRNWSAMVKWRDSTMKEYQRLFVSDKMVDDLIYDIESFFPRFCGMLQIEEAAEYFCGVKKASAFLPPEDTDLGPTVDVKVRIEKTLADNVSKAAARENMSRQKFLYAILQRIAALELQKLAAEAEAAPYKIENEPR